MEYRSEIDGLRAIAVIPVILFHAGFQEFSGGFVGVDIFFVISGYLITTIILSEKEKGVFSLVNFYDRRARRILPALFFVMFVSLPFAWFWLLPSDLKDFSQSLVAVSTFSSNILFWQETGYWGVENELKPLLHTWSLAVEEQYYIIFPLFLLLMWRFRKRWIFSSFILLAISSLLVSQWAAYNNPMANFFLLPTRAWELAIGASIAFYFLYKKPAIKNPIDHRFRDEIMSFTGIIMIMYSIFVFNETTPFPSFFALIPTIGAGLIIAFSSSKTFVGRVLGSKPLVGIGLISYSAYLWHQPIFAFVRHRSLIEPNENTFIALVVLTFICAYLSWRYVEKPFRTKGVFSRKFIFLFWIFGSSIFITIGILGHLTKGFNQISNTTQLTNTAAEDKLKINHGLNKKCERAFTLAKECRTSNEPNILIWGDSFAMHLIQGIVASHENPKIIQMTKSVCGPFFDLAPIDVKHGVKWAEDCLTFTNNVREWLKENHTVKYVVVSSPFSQYLSPDNQLLLRNGSVKQANIKTTTQEFNKTLNELVSMGVTPIVFSPPPATGQDLGRCLEKKERFKDASDVCDFDMSQLSDMSKMAYHFLNNIDKSHKIIKLESMICENGRCMTNLDNTWIYRDKGHLSHSGSEALGIKYGFYDLIIDQN